MTRYYSIRQGESIRDASLNATGSVDNWFAILDANGFDTWTPDLQPGINIIIPDNVDVQKNVANQLVKYPANNALDIIDFDERVSIFLSTFSSAAPVVWNSNITADDNTYYTVKQGESIRDVSFNATGSIDNWFTILDANNFDTWTPDLQPGQKIIIPVAHVKEQNTITQLQQYPANNALDIIDFDEKVNEFINIFTNNWILATGYWNDDAYWVDTNFWID